jgi:hypothetical protein
MSEQQAEVVTIPPEVRAFAAQQKVEQYLPGVLELTRSTFPGTTVSVGLEVDPEMPDDRHITLFARGVRLSPEQAVEATGQWDRGLLAVCPAPLAWVFRLGVGFARSPRQLSSPAPTRPAGR